MKWTRLAILFFLEINILMALSSFITYPYINVPFFDTHRFEGLSFIWNDRLTYPPAGIDVLTPYAKKGDTDAIFALNHYYAFHTPIDENGSLPLPFPFPNTNQGTDEFYIATALMMEYLHSCSNQLEYKNKAILLMRLAAKKQNPDAIEWLKHFGYSQSLL